MSQLKSIENHYFCEILINDKPALMLFDTGASMSHISNNFARNCKVVGQVKNAGQTGILGKTIEVKEILNIKIDDLQIDKHHFIIDEKVSGPERPGRTN